MIAANPSPMPRAARAAYRQKSSDNGFTPLEQYESRPSICRGHGIVVEVHVTVGLGPQADASADRRGPVMLERELAIEISFDLVAGDPHLEIVPGARRG